MMWRNALWNRLKLRASRRSFSVPTITGIVVCVLYYIFANLNAFPRDPKPYFVIIAVLIPGILFAIGSFYWLMEPKDKMQPMCCRHCGYNMQGHLDNPSHCPECGNLPTPLTKSQTQSSSQDISLIPGFLLLLLFLGSVLLAILLFDLWQKGAFSE